MAKGNEGDNPAGDLARYKNQTLDHRAEAYEAVAHAEAQGVSARVCLNPPDIVRAAHVRALNYADQIRPKKDDLPDLDTEYDEDLTIWSEVLAEVQVPKEGTYDGGHADIYGEQTGAADLRYEKRAVCPATLNEVWSDTELVVAVKSRKRHGGAQLSRTEYDVYLPLYGTRMLLNHLDNCMDALGWLPDSHDKLDTHGFKEVQEDES